MNFARLVDKYSVEFEAVKTSGRYEVGEYIAEEEESIPARGAITSIPWRKIYQSGGYLTEQDLKLFTVGELQGDKVRHKGILYNVEEERDWSEFTGVHAYVLKWAGGNDE